jgi:hypothetical protein
LEWKPAMGKQAVCVLLQTPQQISFMANKLDHTNQSPTNLRKQEENKLKCALQDPAYYVRQKNSYKQNTHSHKIGTRKTN